MIAATSEGPRRPWLSRQIPVPISVKILGLGGLVALMFAAVTLLNVRGTLTRALHGLLEEQAVYRARSIASNLESEMAVADFLEVDQVVRREMAHSDDLRYVVVHDRTGRIVAHTFSGGVPIDVVDATPTDLTREGLPRAYETDDGMVLEAMAPVLGGRAGGVRVAMADAAVTLRLAAITRKVLWQLALCAVFGLGLGTVLASALGRPTNRLALAANKIRSGDFEHRIEEASGDEIGQLAVTFNAMAEALQQYRDEVETKEMARLALLDRVVSAQEEERHRIARELHDELGQSLSTLLVSMRPSAVEGAFPSDVRDQLHDQILALIDQVRQLAWSMRPSILDDYGLDRALARYVQEVADVSGMAIDYECAIPRDAPRLAGHVEVCLYRIAQEAVTNILRHAQAGRASIVLLRQPNEVTLLVEDDGVGFRADEASAGPRDGLGLLGMRERSALVGGNFTIQTAPGEGTVLRVRIPLNGEANDAH